MKQEELRQRLIDGTIRVIARDGLDKASTKLIGLESSLNEAYIYRSFADKEDMFTKTFDYLDEELLNTVMQHADLFTISDLDFDTRCRLYFNAIWKFLLGNRDKCLTYIRYFYSPYFVKYSSSEHEKRFAPFVSKMRSSFKDDADVWMILNHILNVMFDFAIKVHHGHMSESDNYAEHVFRVIYASVKQYFRNSKESEFYSV